MALCSSDEHLQSTFVLLSILPHCYTSRGLAWERKNESPPAECGAHMPLTSFSIIQVCHIYSSGSDWHTRIFYLPAREGSQAMMSRALWVVTLPGATALCYNIFQGPLSRSPP